MVSAVAPPVLVAMAKVALPVALPATSLSLSVALLASDLLRALPNLYGHGFAARGAAATTATRSRASAPTWPLRRYHGDPRPPGFPRSTGCFKQNGQLHGNAFRQQ